MSNASWFRPYRPALAKVYGVSCALVYASLESAMDRFKDRLVNGMFYYKVDDMVTDTCLSDKTVRRALGTLKNSGLIYSIRRAREEATYYKLLSQEDLQVKLTTGHHDRSFSGMTGHHDRSLSTEDRSQRPPTEQVTTITEQVTTFTDISESKKPDSDNLIIKPISVINTDKEALSSIEPVPLSNTTIKAKKVRTPSIVDTLWYYWCSKIVDSGLVTESFNTSDRGKFYGRMKSSGTGALTYASLEELKECIDLFVASKPDQYRFGWFYQSHKRLLDQIRAKKNSKFATNVGINVQLPTEI